MLKRESPPQVHSAKQVLAELENEKKDNTISEDRYEERFTPGAMLIAIADKKKRRAKKGLEFNCIMLNREDVNGDELVKCLRFLEKEKLNIPNNTRFQMICGSRAVRRDFHHWSAIDVLVKDGKLHFYVLDAANVSYAVVSIMREIYLNCPNSVMTYTSGFMQRDQFNCATFSLDHVFRLAKILDLHEQLAKMQHDIEWHFAGDVDMTERLMSVAIDNDAKNAVSAIKYVSLNQFPAHFGPLLRNLQFYQPRLASFFSKGMKGNDNKDLKTYAEERCADQKDPLKNNGITNKRKQIKIKAALYMKELSEEEYKAVIEKNNDYKNVWQGAKFELAVADSKRALAPTGSVPLSLMPSPSLQASKKEPRFEIPGDEGGAYKALENAVKTHDMAYAQALLKRYTDLPQVGYPRSLSVLAKNNIPLVMLLLDHKDMLNLHFEVFERPYVPRTHVTMREVNAFRVPFFNAIIDDMLSGKKCTWRQEVINFVARRWKDQLYDQLMKRIVCKPSREKIAILRKVLKKNDGESTHTLGRIFEKRRGLFERFTCFSSVADGTFSKIRAKVAELKKPMVPAVSRSATP